MDNPTSTPNMNQILPMQIKTESETDDTSESSLSFGPNHVMPIKEEPPVNDEPKEIPVEIEPAPDAITVKSESDPDELPLSSLKTTSSTSNTSSPRVRAQPKFVWHMRFTCTFCQRKCVNKIQLRTHISKFHPQLVEMCDQIAKPCFVLLNRNPPDPPTKKKKTPREWVFLHSEYIQKLDLSSKYCITGKHLISRFEKLNDDGSFPTKPSTSNSSAVYIENNSRSSTTATSQFEESSEIDDLMEISEDILLPNQNITIKTEDMDDTPVASSSGVTNSYQGPSVERVNTRNGGSNAAPSTNATSPKEPTTRKNTFLKPHEISSIVSSCFRKLSNNEKLLIYNEVYHPGKSFNNQFLSLIQNESIRVLWTPNNKVSKPPMLCKRLKMPRNVNFMEGLQPYEPKMEYLNGSTPYSQAMLNLNKFPDKSSEPSATVTTEQSGDVGEQSQAPIEIPITQVASLEMASSLPTPASNVKYVSINTPGPASRKRKVVANENTDDCSPKIVSSFTLPNAEANGSSAKQAPVIKCRPTQMLLDPGQVSGDNINPTDQPSVIMPTTSNVIPVSFPIPVANAPDRSDMVMIPYFKFKKRLQIEDVEILLMKEFINDMTLTAEEKNLVSLVKFRILLNKFQDNVLETAFIVNLYINFRNSFVLNVSSLTGEMVDFIHWPFKFQNQLLKSFTQTLLINQISNAVSKVMSPTATRNAEVFTRSILDFSKN